jgi:hypothetical protein
MGSRNVHITLPVWVDLDFLAQLTLSFVLYHVSCILFSVFRLLSPAFRIAHIASCILYPAIICQLLRYDPAFFRTQGDGEPLFLTLVTKPSLLPASEAM